jgi:hypothetical protein
LPPVAITGGNFLRRMEDNLMKKERNELLEFLAGMAMLVVGLYLLTTHVDVSMGFFGGYIRIGGWHMSTGMTVIPFIIGVVWLFVNPDSFAAKLVAGLGVLIILACIIMSTRFSMIGVSLYEWLLMLVLIFGGGGMVARILFKTPKGYNDEKKDGRDK